MKIKSRMVKINYEGETPMHKHLRKPPHHLPPHQKEQLVHIEFEEKDWIVLKEIFGDEDTTLAAAQIIEDAPIEMQILANQLLNMIKEI